MTLRTALGVLGLSLGTFAFWLSWNPYREIPSEPIAWRVDPATISSESPETSATFKVIHERYEAGTLSQVIQVKASTTSETILDYVERFVGLLDETDVEVLNLQFATPDEMGYLNAYQPDGAPKAQGVQVIFDAERTPTLILNTLTDEPRPAVSMEAYVQYGILEQQNAIPSLQDLDPLQDEEFRALITYYALNP